jgi:hypothetical protein
MIGLPRRTRAPSDSQAEDQQAMYYYTYRSAFPNISARRHQTGRLKVQKIQKQVNIVMISHVKTFMAKEKEEREKR